VDRRVAFWEMLLNIVRSKTADEWAAEFDKQRDVWGERFRRDSELLHHPQMTWNRMVAMVADPQVGLVRQPAALVRMDRTPAVLDVAPPLGEHDAAVRGEAGAGRATRPASAVGREGRPPPLEGVTVVELGTYYAAPYGATLLAE